ncbi:hypothetical protein [Archangium lansingense]|uniref:Lipoprotein n=1 Tax=Archangium lansingense TaxID=2995310 RepID=A0ABT4A009_9BACT|nr:hypothetical protein [Archangium lansinium]MCY1074965.1 hypothetical protein [Archangium lansinium]
MRFRACIALLLFVSACTTSAPSPREPAARDPRLANLQRAAARKPPVQPMVSATEEHGTVAA